MRVAIVGGGAAGFFLAINLKEMCPVADVTIFESALRPLRKVAVSGGGRCNCTNTFRSVRSLESVYPRGARLMRRLLKAFGPEQAYSWFESHGVPLVVQADECVFPQAQDSQAIIDCFLCHARNLGVKLILQSRISSLGELADFDAVCITVGGQPRAEGLQWLADGGLHIEPPVPSLFALSIADASLRSLMGTVVEQVEMGLPGTKHVASGTLLITHWGVSGPATLCLSSYAARHLHDCQYACPLRINWLAMNDEQTLSLLHKTMQEHRRKLLSSLAPGGLPQRLWHHLLQRALPERGEKRWAELSRRDLNRMVNTLSNDTYPISGRGIFKEEFVTCGGVSLADVNPATLQSRKNPRLYFAGEVLDIDGVTGGFNFQAAWSTAYAVATSLARRDDLSQ